MLWQWERSGLARVLVVGSMVRSFVRPLVRLFVRFFVCSFVRLSVRSFVRPSVLSSLRLLVRKVLAWASTKNAVVLNWQSFSNFFFAQLTDLHHRKEHILADLSV